jgi:hypothetical protein
MTVVVMANHRGSTALRSPPSPTAMKAAAMPIPIPSQPKYWA